VYINRFANLPRLSYNIYILYSPIELTGKKDLIRKSLAFGIVLLFIVASLTPMVIGENKETKDIDFELEAELSNLRYLCTTPDGFDEAKYGYCKEELLNYYPKDDATIVKPVENVVREETYLPLPLDGPMNSSWPMKCHDLHHTGRSPIGTADNPYDELWKYEFDGAIQTSPAIGNDGIIYVGGRYERYSYYLFAIYPNGTLKWRYYTDGLIKRCVPAIAEDGTIYIGAWDDCLHAVNPDGTRKWKFDADADIVSSPAIAEDGTIYFGTMLPRNEIIAVNPDGEEKWRYSTGDVIMSDPAIGNDGTIYIGSCDDYLYAMYPNGTLRWRYKTGDWVTGPPSIDDDGTIYFGSWDHHIYALYPNGTLRWKTIYGYGSDSNPTIGLDGTIYVPSATKLIAINPGNGEILWEFNLGGGSGKSSPAICADGIIYMGVEIGDRDGGEIVAVNSDGTEHWRQRISNYYVDSSPAIGSDGTIYICSTSGVGSGDSGHLHAFGTSDPNAPEAPTIIGENEGVTGEEYEYIFSTIDPNGDDVYYNIDWGDGHFEDWFGPYASGEEVVVSHTWDEQDTYTIRARAKDTNNLWGPWGELEVTMPVNQHSYSFPLLQWLLERFPNAFPIFRHLIEAQY